MAQCATTALAGAVPRPCVRGARGRFGGLGPVPGVVSLPFPPSRPACPALRVSGIPSGCHLPSLAGTPFHAVCAFRELGPVALLVVPACPLRVCALALPRRPRPPPLGGVACAPRAVPALGACRAVPRGPCPSARPAPVPCSVWRAWGGAVRSRFPSTWLWVRGVRAWGPVTNTTARTLASWLCALWGRHEGARGWRLLPGCGASGVGRSPIPECPPSGRAAGAHYPLAVGAGGCGRGDPSPTPQRALLHAVGAA